MIVDSEIQLLMQETHEQILKLRFCYVLEERQIHHFVQDIAQVRAIISSLIASDNENGFPEMMERLKRDRDIAEKIMTLDHLMYLVQEQAKVIYNQYHGEKQGECFELLTNMRDRIANTAHLVESGLFGELDRSFDELNDIHDQASDFIDENLRENDTWKIMNIGRMKS